MESGQLHLSSGSGTLATLHHVMSLWPLFVGIVPVHCAYCQDTLRGDEANPSNLLHTMDVCSDTLEPRLHPNLIHLTFICKLSAKC